MPQRRWLTVSLQSLSPYKNCNLLPFSALVVSFMEHYFSISSAFAIHCLCHSRLARGISLSLHPTEDFNLILGFSAGCGSPNWSCVILVTQWCPNLCNPMDCSQPGSSVHGIFQARIVEWVAISFSNWSGSEVKWLSRVRLFATPWTAAYHAPPSMGFSRQEYWSGLPFPSPEQLRTQFRGQGLYLTSGKSGMPEPLSMI